MHDMPHDFDEFLCLSAICRIRFDPHAVNFEWTTHCEFALFQEHSRFCLLLHIHLFGGHFLIGFEDTVFVNTAIFLLFSVAVIVPRSRGRMSPFFQVAVGVVRR
jgi:hypothetical protein